MKMLSRYRPRPSIDMRMPASVRVVIQADPRNWLPYQYSRSLAGRARQWPLSRPRCRSRHALYSPTPAQHLAVGPVNNRHQKQKTVFARHERDVGALVLVRSVNQHHSQQLRIDWVLRMRLAGFGAFVDCLQLHRRREASHAMESHDRALPAQIGSDLTRHKNGYFPKTRSISFNMSSVAESFPAGVSSYAERLRRASLDC